jgi:hypothetical protein
MDPITIFGITLTVENLFFFAVFILSEWVGSNPKLSENTVSGLFLHLVRYLALGRNEDDKVKKIRDILRK